jgi:phosphate transport system substrate-binding protein
MVLGLTVCVAPVGAAADAPLRIGGTGMALAAMRQIGDSLRTAAPDIRVEVMPSLGTPGGLRALAARAIDIAVTGRTLTAEERNGGLVEAGCATTPLVFASSHPAPGGIRLADLPTLYAHPSPTWPDGVPLKVILRSRAGSENGYLVALLPAMAAALEQAYKRSGVPVATTDQENAEIAVRTAGSFAVMTLLQIRAERLDLRPVALDGVAPALATVADKTYPMSARICLVLPAAPKPSAAAFVAHVRSEAGRALIASLGAMPFE